MGAERGRGFTAPWGGLSRVGQEEPGAAGGGRRSASFGGGRAGGDAVHLHRCLGGVMDPDVHQRGGDLH